MQLQPEGAIATITTMKCNCNHHYLECNCNLRVQLHPLLLRVQLQPEGAIATITIESAIATGSAIAAPSRQNSVPRKSKPTRNQHPGWWLLSGSVEATSPRLGAWRGSDPPRPAVEVLRGLLGVRPSSWVFWKMANTPLGQGTGGWL